MRTSRGKKLTTLSDLNTCIAKWCLRKSISISNSSHGFISSLIVEPDANQLKQLATGSGNPLAEMHQINSSAGLAINYHKLLEQANVICRQLGFEITSMQKRCTIIENEKTKAKRLFDAFLQDIGWTECSFESKNYNDSDVLDAIRDTQGFERFIAQYCLR